MITRFRIEAKENSKERVADALLDAVGILLKETGQTQSGEWECTQEVISGKPGDFQGRMVMLFHPEENNA